MLDTDFLALEPLLMERIDSQCLGIQFVLSAADVDGVQESKQRTPAAHVLYDGYSIQQDQVQRALIRQTWVVVVTVRHVGQRNQSALQREAAGPLVMEVVQALMGWRPGPEYSRMSLASSPYRPNFGRGFAYVPVAFTTDIKIEGVD